MARNYFEKETDEWLRRKWGKFSASRISELIPAKGMEMFDKGALTYIAQVAREAYTEFNSEESIETYDMKMGKLREPQAFKHLYQLIGFDGLYHHGGGNPLFIDYCPDSGCSPDALAPLPDGTYSFGAEIKAPKGSTHFEYLRTIATPEDLKKVCMPYWVQLQFSMMACRCDLWLWTSYNEYFPLRTRALIIEVKLDKSFADNFDLRLRMAVKKKYEFIEEVKTKHG